MGPGHRSGDHGSTQVHAHDRGPWEDDDWKGWWGDEPVFRTPCFVLTHHPRPPLEMAGGTTFHFIHANPEDALEQARTAANGLDVRIGGGPTTVREFLEALERRFERVEATSSPSGVTHVVFER